jgi:hypothetical protein
VAKALPAFSQLDLHDQVIHNVVNIIVKIVDKSINIKHPAIPNKIRFFKVSSVSAFSMAAFHLVNRLHAMRRDSKTIILPENSFPVIKFHTQLSTDLV